VLDIVDLATGVLVLNCRRYFAIGDRRSIF